MIIAKAKHFPLRGTQSQMLIQTWLEKSQNAFLRVSSGIKTCNMQSHVDGWGSQPANFLCQECKLWPGPGHGTLPKSKSLFPFRLLDFLCFLNGRYRPQLWLCLTKPMLEVLEAETSSPQGTAKWLWAPNYIFFALPAIAGYPGIQPYEHPEWRRASIWVKTFVKTRGGGLQTDIDSLPPQNQVNTGVEERIGVRI